MGEGIQASPGQRFLIGRYHEIALKGRNRWRFVDRLKRNLRLALGDYRLSAMRGEGPRLFAQLPDELSDETAAERAGLVFGMQNFSISRAVELDLDAMKREALRAARSGGSWRSFRITTRRSDKRFPMTSMEVDREIGAAVNSELGIAVDLENPELNITVEIMPNHAYVTAGKRDGAGGLPVGIAGRGMALLSGGIDSPVASFRMMRRGLELDFVHFHSHPLVSNASQEKALELATHLTHYQFRATLQMVAFGELQREIVARTLRPLRVILYRRFMMRIAGALAAQSGASALVTGESLGQVASQTLENMRVIECAAPLPILRPLVGMDKNEIIEQARKLGTFETSILPDQDCCSLFVPNHPETRAQLEEVVAAESALDVDRLVAEALARTTRVELRFP